MLAVDPIAVRVARRYEAQVRDRLARDYATLCYTEERDGNSLESGWRLGCGQRRSRALRPTLRGPITRRLSCTPKFAGVGVDDVLAGCFPDPSVCAHCGQRRDGSAVSR